ncbi:uncharacterized protein LOC141631192 [Silene latifolia]|uniref:uncharacterized protein LOC141631192 n=1 Tax=Silene latifolia TaxID=37657 RepID=UPI003D76D423
MGSGLGVIIRDHNGQVVRAGVQQVKEAWDADVAEAKAMEFGLITAFQMELQNIVVEADCLPLVTMLRAKSFPRNYFDNIGKVIVELASRFNCIEFKFVRREGNRAAHCMAHLLPLVYSTRFWVGMVPESITMIVSSDLEPFATNE